VRLKSRCDLRAGTYSVLSRILHKFLFLCRDPNLTPPDHPLLKVKKSKIALFISVQLFVYAASVAISQTIGEKRKEKL
jgi:hypothetical protein